MFSKDFKSNIKWLVTFWLMSFYFVMNGQVTWEEVLVYFGVCVFILFAISAGLRLLTGVWGVEALKDRQRKKAEQKNI